MKKLASILVSLLTIICVSGQPTFPEDGPLFKDDVVPRIDITINPDTLEWLYQHENLESDIEFTAEFIFDNGEIRDTIYPVGFRLRGNTSRYSQKKSFKVSFNTFESGAKYYGVEKLNLNGEHNDPTVMRSKVCWDILRKMEIPAPRSNHVQVYINGDYYGLYINVEHIDEEFVKSRFEYNNGNLYKCLWPADLQYLGDNPDLYKEEHNGRRAYELKINKEADDYTDIANFIDILNNTNSENLGCELDDVFNIYDYLKVIAADVLFGNWDGYIYNKNNYYIYHNTITDKFEYIPYDLDNTLGIDWIGREWATRDMYDWQNHGEYRPLYERLMDNIDFRNQYTFYMDRLVNNLINLDSLKSSISNRRDMISTYVEDDPYYPLDWGFSTEDFYNSFNNGLGGHVDYGLFPYLDTRISSINSQLESSGMIPVIKYINHTRVTTGEVHFRAHITARYNPVTVELVYTLEEQSTQTEMMYDDGNHGDGGPDDGTYGCYVGNIPESSSMNYQISATDSNDGYIVLPCEPIFIPPGGSDQYMLVINEFMASNENTIADEHGDYDDWIEIYNPEDITIWLGNKTMTDDLGEPNKWQMPDAYIEPQGFVLIWADKEPDQGPFHANFKLSKDGEEIGLFRDDMSSIDEIVYGEQSTDISFGRESDGNPDWIFFNQPTPLASNQTSDIAEGATSDSFIIYPNPAVSDIVYLNKTLSFSVFNIYGQHIETSFDLNFINISNYNKGVYIVVSDQGHKQKLIIN